MERLTKRIPKGKAWGEWESILYKLDHGEEVSEQDIFGVASYAEYKEGKEVLISITEKLAEYEDTGLTPNQIYELAKANYKHQEITEELEEDCDYWKLLEM